MIARFRKWMMLLISGNGLYVEGLVLGVLAALIWGAFPVLTKFGMAQELGAFDIAAIRFGVAGLILLPVFWRYKFDGISAGGVILLVCGAGLPYILLANWGLQYSSAGHFGSITPGSMLFFSSLGSWLILGEKINKARLAGMGVVLVGLGMILYENFSAGGLYSKEVLLGDLTFVFCGFLWGCYTVSTRIWALASMHLTAMVASVSMLVYLPVYFVLNPEIFDIDALFSRPLKALIIQGVYQGILSAFLALLFYTRAVRILGAAKGAVFGALVPAFAISMAYSVLDEIPGLWQIAGVVAVTAGMILALELYLLWVKNSVRETLNE